MKLAAVDPRLDINLEHLLNKEVRQNLICGVGQNESFLVHGRCLPSS